MLSRSTGIFTGKTWSRRDPEKPPSRQLRWARENEAKRQAHEAVRQALLKGTLRRGRCEICGSLRVDGRHDSYDKPLDVRWFCRRHHLQLHAQMRRAAE